jgi:Rrf2 family iron-sulfur cluster assembly transcriptional regulator
MRVATKGRYAVTAMLDLAEQAIHHKPQALASISERQAISLSYLEQLFCKLRQAQLVESARGPGGGYLLARSPVNITVADIIIAVDGIDNEPQDSDASSTALWATLHQQMLAYLGSVTLASLMDEQLVKKVDQAFSENQLKRLAEVIAHKEARVKKVTQAESAPKKAVPKKSNDKKPVVNSVFNWGKFLVKTR